jgi:hypothetical protein
MKVDVYEKIRVNSPSKRDVPTVTFTTNRQNNLIDSEDEDKNINLKVNFLIQILNIISTY